MICTHYRTVEASQAHNRCTFLQSPQPSHEVAVCAVQVRVSWVVERAHLSEYGMLEDGEEGGGEALGLVAHECAAGRDPRDDALRLRLVVRE